LKLALARLASRDVTFETFGLIGRHHRIDERAH
jgi:hypothetical protein